MFLILANTRLFHKILTRLVIAQKRRAKALTEAPSKETPPQPKCAYI